MPDKVMTMRDAVANFIPDGALVAIGLALESAIPFAAGHEIIRQRKQNLTLIGPISDMLFDQLIGAGCIAKIIAAWVGNVSAGLGHNYRRAMECLPPRITVEDHSNFSISLALTAGAMGVPFIPTRTLLGSDLLKSNPQFRVIDDDGVRLVRVPAVNPDVTIIHAQRSDADGHAHCWGGLGICAEAALAAKQVMIVCEELVSASVIRSDPNRVLVPGFKVCAVVSEPGGAHPSPVQGYYRRDHAAYHDYHALSRTADGFAAWLNRWIDRVAGRQEYLAQLDVQRWYGLLLKEHRFAAAVDYGY